MLLPGGPCNQEEKRLTRGNISSRWGIDNNYGSLKEKRVEKKSKGKIRENLVLKGE